MDDSVASDGAAPPPTTLPALPEAGIERVLCVVAHPDDMEYGTSAAVAAWTDAGVQVSYLLLTAGEAGMAEPPETVGPLRATEQRRACDTVGVRDLRILSHPDGMLSYGLELRADVARVIRELHPDLVLTANFDFEAYGGLNQADHRIAGLAVVDATRDAANPWVFREQIENDALRPWQTRALLIAGDERPTHVKAVGKKHVDAAVTSLSCHEAYLAHVTGHPAPEDFIPEALREGGAAGGVDYGVDFRVHDLGGLESAPDSDG